MRILMSVLLCLMMSVPSATAQSAGEARLPPVTGEAENLPIIQFVTYRLNSPGSNGADWGFVVDIHLLRHKGTQPPCICSL
jgi:hypothetical protein